MTNLTVTDFSSSPFDGIRHLDEIGNEYWCARELMPMLGYKQWQKFKAVIDNAIENIETLTSSTVEHFLPVEVKNRDSEGNRLKGRTGIDYKLSRLACYHIALSCDSRGNDSVKAAKHYFAIKTREAETVIPAQNDRIRELELELELTKAKTYYMDRRDAIQKLHGVEMLALLDGRPDVVIQVREVLTESIICKDGRNVSFVGKSLAEAAKELGFKTGKELEYWLTKIGREDLISQGMRAIQAPYIAEEHYRELKKVWANKRTSAGRQLLLGE